MRVEQSDGLEHHVDRDDDHDGRQDALGDDPEKDVAIAEAPHEALSERAREEYEKGQRHG